MNYQLIPANKNERDLFVKTTKSFNLIGIFLMWLCMLLMFIVFTAKSSILSLGGFVAFTLAFLFFKAAERSGGIFEYLVVQPNHTGRRAVFMVTMLTIFTCFPYVVFFNTLQAGLVISCLGIVVAAAVTALRFVGIEK